MANAQETPTRDPFRYLMKLATERPVARYRAGAEHAYHMHLRGQHLAASRAAALRVALVAAKQRRRMLAR